MQKQKQKTTKSNSFIDYISSNIKSLDQFKSFFETDNSFRIESSVLKSVDLNITDSITKNDVKLTFVIPDISLDDYNKHNYSFTVDKDLVKILIEKLIPYQDCINAKNINLQNDTCQTETNQTLSFNEQKDKLKDYIKALDIILDSFNCDNDVERTNKKQTLVTESSRCDTE